MAPTARPDVWGLLTLFESSTVCAEHLANRGIQQDADSRGWLAASHILQGRGYMDAAATAGPAVAPLLQYYGVLCLTRAAILLRGSDPAPLERSHGLGLRFAPRSRASDDMIRTASVCVERKGTFGQLVKAAPPSTSIAVPVDLSREAPTGQTFELTRRAPNVGAAATVLELLERLVTISWYTTLVYESPPQVLRADLLNCSGQSLLLVAPIHPRTDLEAAQVATLLGVREELLQRTSRDAELRKCSAWQIAIDTTLPYADQIPYLSRVQEDTYLVAPLKDGSSVSQMELLYMLSYATGMLCRYHPAEWLALHAHRVDDRALPILRNAFAHVQDAYPELVLRLLLGAEV
jgi:hypothetical protein